MIPEITQIPLGLMKPGFHGEFNSAGGSNALPANSLRLLLIGQRTGGSVAALEPAQVYSEDMAKAYWGDGSVLTRMVGKAIKHKNTIEIHGIGLADAAASAAATASVALTGTATAAGSVVVYLGNERIEVAAQVGATAADVALALKAEIDARTSLPVTATAATGTLTVTAKNKGPVGNQIGVYAASSAAGLTIPAKTMLSTGATAPDLSAALSAIVPGSWDVIVFQDDAAEDLALLKAHAELVSNPVEQRPCRVFVASADTLSAVSTLSDGVNHERLHIAALRGSRSPSYEVAAVIGAEVAASFDPAMPFNGAPLTGIHCPADKDRWLRTEQETLLHSGVAPLEVVDGSVCIVRLVTTRHKTAGVADLTLIDTNTMAIYDYFRKAWRTRMVQKFGKAKLDDRTIDSVNTQTLDVALRLQDLRILQNVESYKDLFVTVRDPNSPGRILQDIPTPVVPGLHQIYSSFRLILN